MKILIFVVVILAYGSSSLQFEDQESKMTKINEQTNQFANSLVGKYYVDEGNNIDLSGKQVCIDMEIILNSIKFCFEKKIKFERIPFFINLIYFSPYKHF